jgi:hypothetical protein
VATAPAERVRAGLLQPARRIGRPAGLIPTDDAGRSSWLSKAAACGRGSCSPSRPAICRRLAGKHSLYHLCRELGVACLHATMHSATGPAVTTGRGMPRPAVDRSRQGRPCGRKTCCHQGARAVTKGLLP